MNSERNPWDPGAIIDGLFEIKTLLGMGGMGAVFQVRHLEWDVELALKVPHSEAAEFEGFEDDFVREALTWVNLGVHPNIVQCWFVRECYGIPALFLDYLPGGSLEERIEAGTFATRDFERAIDVAIQTADGLTHAHRNGVVHRDIKPGNLLVRGESDICVSDFGLVKDLSGPSILETEEYQCLGTPAYAAPEQWQGSEVSPQTDLYALGAVLYELCLGQLPFQEMAGHSTRALVRRQASRPPPRPSDICSEIPAELEELIMDCLAIEPEKRPGSAHELRTRLTEIYQRLSGHEYPRPEPMPALQRADSLNNRAVSLHHLKRPEEAMAAWNEAIEIDGQHLETLYNRSLVQWRRCEVSTEQVHSRLEGAGATFQLGLFLLEAGLYEQALAYLQKAEAEPEGVYSGVVKRAIGDALMYLGQFFAAEKSYGQAVNLMPLDESSLLRRRLARLGLRQLEGLIYFPRMQAVGSAPLAGPACAVVGDDESGLLVLAGRDFLQAWEPTRGRCLWSTPLEQPLRELACEPGRVVALHQRPGRVWNLADGREIWCTDMHEQLLAVSIKARCALIRGSVSRLAFLANGRTLWELPQELGEIRCGAFTQDGQKVLVASSHGELVFLDLESGQIESRFSSLGQINRIIVLKHFPVALCAGGSTVAIWELEQQELLGTLTCRIQVEQMYLDPHQELVRVCSEETFEIWELSSQKKLFEGTGPSCFIDGARLLHLSDEGRLVLTSVYLGEQLRRWGPPKGPVDKVYCQDPAAAFTTSSQPPCIQLWELDEDTRVGERELLLNRGRSHLEVEQAREAFEKHLTEVEQAAAEDKPEVAYRHLLAARLVPGYAREDRALRWLSELARKLRRKGLQGAWERHMFTVQNAPEALACTSDAEHVYLLADGHVFHYAGANKLLREVRTSQRITSLAIAGQVGVLMGTDCGHVVLFETATRKTMPPLAVGSPVACVAGDRSGRFAAVATRDGQLHLLDLFQGIVLRSFEDQQAEQRVLAVTGDLRFGVSGPDFSLWDLPNAKLLMRSRHLKTKEVQARQVLGAALSEEARFALTAAADNVVRYWDTATGKSVLHLEGHEQEVVGVALWEHLDVALTVCRDGLLRVFDLADGGLLEAVNPHQGELVCGQHSGDGRFFLTGGADGVVRVWEFDWELEMERSFDSSRSALGRIASFFRARR